MSPEDFAAIAYLTPKPGRKEDCLKLAKDLMQSTWAEDEGCICYYLYQRQDNPKEWVFHERWKDGNYARTHLQRLFRVYGRGDEKIPWCPAAIREPWEKFEFIQLIPVA